MNVLIDTGNNIYCKDVTDLSIITGHYKPVPFMVFDQNGYGCYMSNLRSIYDLDSNACYTGNDVNEWMIILNNLQTEAELGSV